MERFNSKYNNIFDIKIRFKNHTLSLPYPSVFKHRRIRYHYNLVLKVLQETKNPRLIKCFIYNTMANDGKTNKMGGDWWRSRKTIDYYFKSTLEEKIQNSRAFVSPFRFYKIFKKPFNLKYIFNKTRIWLELEGAYLDYLYSSKAFPRIFWI